MKEIETTAVFSKKMKIPVSWKITPQIVKKFPKKTASQVGVYSR